MNRSVLTLAILLVSTTLVVAQLDTVALKRKVDNLSTEREHIEFWKRMFRTDQDLMRRSDKELINQENLLLGAYYLNRFGYPDWKLYGKNSLILNMVWVHTSSQELLKITFPIILQAYLTRSITEKFFREYYLQGIYHRYFDDNDYLTKPLGAIFKDLNLSTAKKINIPAVIFEIERFNKFIHQEKEIIGIWKYPDIIDTSYLHEKLLVSTIEGQRAIIFRSIDNRYYCSHIRNTQFDPIELTVLDKDLATFKATHRKTSDYYRITLSGDLEYIDNGGSRILQYTKQE